MFSADLGVNKVASTPAATDPPFQKVALLLHGDGTNGAQNNTFVDGSTNNFTITRTGNVAQGTFSPFSLADGQWSNYFDGTGDYLTTSYSTTAFDWWTGDYTLEALIYPTAFTGWSYNVGGVIQGTLIGNATTTSTINYWSFGVLSDGTVRFNYYNGSNVLVTSTAIVSLNAWNHIAMTKTSSGIVIWVNGVGNTATAVSGTPQSSSGTTLTVGQVNNTTINGYVSNIRIVKGTAVYTANFTPPTSALTAISGTSLLTCQSNRFKDNSSNNFTITPAGDTKVTAFSPFAPSAAYSASTNGGSGYFDGSGDYLSVPISSAFDFGTGDFTVEGCFYCTVATGRRTIYSSQKDGSGYCGLMCEISDAVFKFSMSYTGSWNLLQVNCGAVNINAWNHFAFVRNGSNLFVYINGIQTYTSSISTNPVYNGTAQASYIGEYSTGYSLPFLGYISTFRIVKGTAVYTSNFTPPTAPLTAITNTQLLLNCTNAGIIDNAGKNDIETVGNAQISTSVKKYGTGSLYFDGTGDYLINQGNINAFTFGTGDFTIEFWVYLNNITQTAVIYDTRPLGTNGLYPMISTVTGSFRYVISGVDRITSSTYSATTWYHVAVCRSGTATKMFVNGTQSGSTYTDTNNYICADSRPCIGCNSTYLGSAPLDGYIDDLRITKGQALYTSNFTPPTQAFPNQ